MADDLEDAAKRGRAKRRAAEDEKARAQARSDEAERVEGVRRFQASLTRWGIFRVSGMGPYYLFLLWLFVLAPLNILALVWLDPSENVFRLLVFGRGRFYLFILAMLLVIAIWYVAGAMCRRAAAREQAWLASLPYRVTEYAERLGEYPSKSGKDL